MTDAERSWLTVDELAEIASVSGKTVYREIKRGHLAAERAGGGRSSLIIERPEAGRWLAEYKRTGQ